MSLTNYINTIDLSSVIIPDIEETVLFNIFPDDYILQQCGCKIGSDIIPGDKANDIIFAYKGRIKELLSIGTDKNRYIVSNVCECKINPCGKHQDTCDYIPFDKYKFTCTKSNTSFYREPDMRLSINGVVDTLVILDIRIDSRSINKKDICKLMMYKLMHNSEYAYYTLGIYSIPSRTLKLYKIRNEQLDKSVSIYGYEISKMNLRIE